MKMNVVLKRVLVFCLCIALLPVHALAFSDGTPVTRSDFMLSFHLNADSFPDDGLAHYKDWESFLSKLTLSGLMDSQSYPAPIDRVYFDGGLYVNDKLTIPFEYDAYAQFRYVRSPAFGGASVHFNMFNFFQFMLKPYYYMYMPTQYAALVLYPEAAVEMWSKYAQPMTETFGGEGERVISHEDLYALCEKLNAIVLEDDYDKAYYFVTSLLVDQGMDWTAMEKLGCWEVLLDYLDPEMQGMTIAEKDGTEIWTVGETTVFEKTVSDEESVWTVYLPDPEGYEFSVELVQKETERTAQLLILLDGEEYLNVSAGIDGLPAQGETKAQGNAWADITGSVLYEEIAPMRFAYDYIRTADAKPYDLSLTVDMIHNETEKPCLGFAYQAAVEEMPHTVLVERPYDDQDDFFHLNESFIEEYKERFLHTLALAAAPILLELPAGVISDAVAYMEETGILAFLGIE